MPVGRKDHRGGSVPPAVGLGRPRQPLNFSLGEILTSAQIGVWATPWCDCSFYGGGCDKLEVRFGHMFHQSCIDDCSYNARSLNSTQSDFGQSSQFVQLPTASLVLSNMALFFHAAIVGCWSRSARPRR